MVIVLSGINLFSGGTLKIYHDVLWEIVQAGIDRSNQIIAFVYKKELFSDIKGNISFIEIRKAKKTYFHRMYYEYIFFQKWSERRHIDIWIAMHDLSPNVKARHRYTYFHSAQIFYDMPKNKIKYDLRSYLLTKFYKYFIRINSKKIEGYIVQADWIKEKLEQLFEIDNILIHSPDMGQMLEIKEYPISPHHDMRFIYPALPRVFKNFEIICESSRILAHRNISDYEIVFTIDGKENRYSRMIYSTYGADKRIKWIGSQSYGELLKVYQSCDALIFPSELETWGLPISEMGCLGKTLILADREYAHASAGMFDNVKYFGDSMGLAHIMEREITLYRRGDYQERKKSLREKKEYYGLLECMIKRLENDGLQKENA